MIWHLLTLPEWRSAREAKLLSVPGGPGSFLHASPDEATALAVANALFRDCADPLLAVGLDTSRLSVPVRYEPADPAPPPGVAAGTLFPHVLGPAGTEAVAGVRYARRGPAGTYTALEARTGTAEALDLFPHPEGGWFRQTFEAGASFEPAGYGGRRSAATAIYFLLPAGAESRWHRVRSDELWLWHRGGPLALRLGGHGARPGETVTAALGPDLGLRQHPQYLVPGGCWQSARPAVQGEEVLVSCVVAPGFDFADFEEASPA